MKNSQIDYDRLITLALAALFFASLALTIVSVSVGNSPMLIVGDGKGYYAWARSVILDGDIDFTNDYKLLYPPDTPPGYMGVRTPNDLVSNIYSIGMAIIEIPGLLVAHCITVLLFPEKADGVSLLYQICITWPLIALILFSFHLLYRAMVSMGVSKFWAFWFCITALMGSNLIHYTAKEPTMSHGAGVALINILVFFIARYDMETHLPSWVKIIRPGLLVLALWGVSIPGRLRNLSFWVLISFAGLSIINGLWKANHRAAVGDHKGDTEECEEKRKSADRFWNVSRQKDPEPYPKADPCLYLFLRQ